MMRRTAVAVAVVASVALTGSIAWVATGAGSPAGPETVPRTDPGVATSEETRQAVGAAELAKSFLDDWVDDGRVVRRDQGGDTVSEGQAYGMLAAVALESEDEFDAIWRWTQDNLVRPDGLVAWRWDDGAVVDAEPASDADLDIARALVLAGDRFDEPGYTAEGVALSAVIMEKMTASTAAGRILLPGVWAADTEPYAYNPSYASPVAFDVLGAATGDARWDELAAGSAAVTTTLLSSSALPPDWAQVHADGRVDPMPGARGTGTDVRYSYDAARLPLRYAESCDPADRGLAAMLAPALSRTAEPGAELDLGGGRLSEGVHPLAWGARAASLAAAGDAGAAREDLTSAARTLGENPTYYGAAWAALSATILESADLGGCALLEGAS